MSSARDGVMFLDEVGELPMNVQAKLLRALQERKIRKVGANREEEINCKFVCATNQNLQAMVKEGTFRKDLYARICTLEINISPLRERLPDIEPICNSIDGGKEFFTFSQILLYPFLLGDVLKDSDKAGWLIVVRSERRNMRGKKLDAGTWLLEL